ncbi:RDD family protein [Catenovulum sp. 2E275]|uniref:RDD family protein n=1 Tax=Catenovulum sp. 2E275 TaxID=2980497 RepID=UPI0021D08020|nr:RDD family protein [Catenovulum sp. 2E275]MCU4677718.1 RDD family protein [Catenovulum sp. 2E275]
MEFLPLEINSEKVYAGFWKRFGAALIDMLVFIPFMVMFHFTQGLSIFSAMVTIVVSSLLFSAYTVYFHYKFGATLGKMAVGIRITFPDGSKIGLKQALLRSSVDLGVAFFMVLAQALAITNADPEIYLNAGFMERAEYIIPLFPAWYGLVNTVSQLWFWSEFLVLLFNKRKRAIHDFIAGTVVIKQEYTEQVAAPDSVADAPSPVS